MALVKTITTDFGIDATYHRIAGVQIHYTEAVVDVILASYVHQEARAAGRLPLGRIADIRFSLVELAATEPDRSCLYQALKRLPDWSDATDC